MNAQKEYFVYLLSCFLSGDTPGGREADFEELYRLADIHDVGGIIATELKTVAPAFQPQGILRSHFNQTIGRTIQDFQKKEAVFRDIGQMLTELKIEHLFVKGAVIRAYYPVPELRTSGDIDVIVPADALQTLHVYARHHEDCISVKEYTTHVLVLLIDGIETEFHDNADVGLTYFDDIFSLCQKEGAYRYCLSDTDHLLYIIAHLAKHLAYRGAGIRMLMDVDVMVRHMAPFDSAAFLEICDTAGIRKTAECLLSLCRRWFRTPVDSTVNFDENTELLNSLEHVLLDGGSFGYTKNAVPARYFDGKGNTGVFAKLRVLLKMAFPPKDYLKKCYPYYAKHAVLYPVARVNRLLDGMLRKRRQASDAVSQIRSGDGNTAYQMELIKELDLNFK